VKLWFYNHGRKRASKDKLNYVRKWTLKLVVGHVKKAEVEEICREETQALPGTQEYIAGYQKALAKVVEDLDEEELSEFQDMVKEWNENKPPPEMQQK
jgi:hypothetical protein